ncbi:dihydrofolate reductase family protein [Nocardioides sp. Kera G14]|uniref:dihydrofolate reductase family protein n=1 Tax=Nocardioides sp. Kera G14 TaxID=2884264 RepID=UPI001D12E754|nr:dihydrofolate reductase family protein [Nocardioides sp. Kera G14]UDY23083.1 dihydrofolate reductase family protein [Nocardioides sp. Kera G14]
MSDALSALSGIRALVGEASWDWPDGPWLRVNMVSSLDGAAAGSDGRAGSINNPADQAVFHELRAGADAIIVGAGTARAEGYHPAGKPLIVVGRELPPTLVDGPGVRLVPGGDFDALRGMVEGLRAEGLTRLLCEGGPTLLGSMLRAGLVDELCLTFTPMIVAGEAPRIVAGQPVDVRMELNALVDVDSTLISRWLVSRP